MPRFPLQVLFEDNHCLVVAKAAGLLMAGDSTGDETLLDVAKQYVKDRYNKPGNVFLGVVHRLDRPVSGVALYARTSKAAARLSAQFRDGTVEKVYRAWVDGKPVHSADTLVDHLEKNEQTNVSRVVPHPTGSSRRAELDYQVIQTSGQRSLLELRPKTGRPHQIRVQLASRGWPILGDVKYGGPRCGNPAAIALHAWSLSFDHPTSGERIIRQLPVPGTWTDWFGTPPSAGPPA